MLFCINLLAQKRDSINSDANAFEHMQFINTWAVTDNPASDCFQPFSKIMKADINYEATSGDFYKVKTPAATNAIVFNSEGYKKINHLTFYGHFNYHYINEYDLNYNNTLFVSEDNPFVFADTIRNKDYTTEIYHLNGRVTYQTNNLKNIISIDLNYFSGNKYCEVDPRADINSINAQFKFGYIHAFSASWQIGLNIGFGNISEEISEEIVGNDDYYFFRQKGLGRYESYLEENGTTVLYQGYNTGTGLQIKYSNKNFESLSQIKFDREIETSQEGTTSAIYQTGDYLASSPGIKQIIRLKKNNTNHDISLNVKYNKIKGIWYYQQQTVDYSSGTGTTIYEILNESVAYLKERYNADFKYRFSKINNNILLYSLSIGSRYSTQETHCYPYEDYESINNIYYYLSGYKNFHVYQNALSIKIKSGYQFNISKELSVEETDLTDKITSPEYAYLSSNFVDLNGTIKYAFNTLKNNLLKPYIVISGNYQVNVGNDDYYRGNNRIGFSMGAGLFF